MALKLKRVTEKDRNSRLDLLESNLERSQTELGDDVRQWKPDDYMHHEEMLKTPSYLESHPTFRFARHPSNINRAGTLSRVLVDQDPGLGDDFVTNGKQWTQPSVREAKAQQKYTMFKGGEASIFAFNVEDFVPLGSGIMLHLKFLRLMFVVFLALAVINVPTMLFASSGTRIVPTDQDALGFYLLSIGNIGYPSLDVYGVKQNVAANQTANTSNVSLPTAYVENTDALLPVLPWMGNADSMPTLKKSAMVAIMSVLDLLSALILL